MTPPQPLRLDTKALSTRLGYVLPPHLQDDTLSLLYLGSQTRTVAVFFHDISGSLWAVRALAKQYGKCNDVTCIGVASNPQLLEQCSTLADLAGHQKSALLTAFCQPDMTFHLIAYSYSCRQACTIAVQLEALASFSGKKELQDPAIAECVSKHVELAETMS